MLSFGVFRESSAFASSFCRFAGAGWNVGDWDGDGWLARALGMNLHPLHLKFALAVAEICGFKDLLASRFASVAFLGRSG